MSYSFDVTGATKAEALVKVISELDRVVAKQSIHVTDRGHAQGTAASLIGILPEASGSQEVHVMVNGSVSIDNNQIVTSENVNVTASLRTKK